MSRAILFLILFALSFAFAQEGVTQFHPPDSSTIEVITNPPEASKSIFSKEGEIDLQKIIAQDTTAEGYLERKGKVQARIWQIDNEIDMLLFNFANSYPAIEPQKPDEAEQDYEKRKTLWQSEGLKQVEFLRKKYERDRNDLLRALEVLDNNVKAATAEAPKADNVDKAKEAAVAATKTDASTGFFNNLSWRGWTRIAAFTAAAVCGTVSVLKHFEMKDYKAEVDRIRETMPNALGDYTQWYEKNKANYNSNKNGVEEKSFQRNIFGIGVGVFAIAGSLTFYF